ncbi:putative ribonuclease H-like domain-containing protein, partial [Tanacetum coccineum]
MDHEDLEQLDEFDLEEMDLKWQVAMISMRMKIFYKKTGSKLQFDAKEPVSFDKTKVECYSCHKTGHFARECRSKGNQDNRRREAWNTGNKEKDNGRRSGKQEDSKALVTLDGEGVDWTSHSEDEQENYAFMACNSLGSDTEAYTQALKKVEAQLVAHQQGQLCQMSAKDKAGLGTSETENSHVNDRYAEGVHDVPPSMTGIYIPSGPETEIDDSQFTYGPKQSKPSESDTRIIVSQPKVWNDAPIIEEYESDSEDEHVSLPSKEQKIPSFAFINTDKHVKTPRQTVIEQNICSQSPKPDKKDCSGLMSKKLGLGFGYTKKACFVYGSFGHLIRDCDFHEKIMAKQVELNKQKGKGNVQRENKPVWNNVQRVNHKNQFVPTAVLTRTGKIPVSTARHNFNSQAILTNAARKISTVKPFVRPKNVFHKTHSPFRRPFNRTTTLRTKFSKQKVNTAEVNAVSVVKGKRETADYPQRALQNKRIVDSRCSRHMTGNKAYLAEYQDLNGGPVAFGGSKGYITGK